MKMKTKKTKKIRSKPSVWIPFGFAVVVLVLVATAACTSGANRLEVRIEVKNPHAIDFEKYDKVLFQKLTMEWPAKDFTPEELIDEFFLVDLSKTIDKKVDPWKETSPEEPLPPNSLLITGKLKLEIKERSKIKEVKDESGKAKNVFTNVQHWDMTMAVVIKDANTGSEIFKQDFTEKLPNVDTSETSTKFNFETIFYKLTTRFVMKIKKTKQMQRRYLLL
jgi:hypothetical protein